MDGDRAPVARAVDAGRAAAGQRPPGLPAPPAERLRRPPVAPRGTGLRTGPASGERSTGVGAGPAVRPVDAAGAVDAKSAPTAPWKTADRFPQRPPAHHSEGDISIALRPGTFLFR